MTRFRPLLPFLLTGPLLFLFAATSRHGDVSVSIPYHSMRSGSGRLVTEIVDPEDHVLGRVERTVDTAEGEGSWQQVIKTDKPLSFEDLIWQRLRYRFEYADKRAPAMEGIASISQIVRRPVVHILGQTEYLAGSRAAIRVIVSEATGNHIAQPGTIHIELLVPNENARPLFSGPINKRGTVEAQFRFPAGLMGSYQLRFVADTAIGSTEYIQPVELKSKASIVNYREADLSARGDDPCPGTRP